MADANPTPILSANLLPPAGLQEDFHCCAVCQHCLPGYAFLRRLDRHIPVAHQDPPINDDDWLLRGECRRSTPQLGVVATLADIDRLEADAMREEGFGSNPEASAAGLVDDRLTQCTDFWAWPLVRLGAVCGEFRLRTSDRMYRHFLPNARTPQP